MPDAASESARKFPTTIISATPDAASKLIILQLTAAQARETNKRRLRDFKCKLGGLS